MNIEYFRKVQVQFSIFFWPCVPVVGLLKQRVAACVWKRPAQPFYSPLADSVDVRHLQRLVFAFFSLSPSKSINFHCPISCNPTPSPHGERQRVHSGEQTHRPLIDLGRCQIHVLWKQSMLVGGTWPRRVPRWSTAGVRKLRTTAFDSDSHRFFRSCDRKCSLQNT